MDTIDGRVTLHGKVDTAAESARAEDIAKSIDGTTQVRNLLQVVPENRREVTELEDAVVNKRVGETIEADPALSDSTIHVKSVNKGVVLLSGNASSLSAHLVAIKDANRVDGVRRVASEIQSPDTLSDREIWEHAGTPEKGEPAARGLGQTFSDMWITTAAKSRLIADGDTPAMDINVDTENGVVTLFGIVPTKEAKTAAEADVFKVGGVKKVDNDLEIVPAAKKKAVAIQDEAAATAVKKRLKTQDEYKDVSVEVKNGVAKLTGTTGSQSARLMAAVAARSCEGIRSVDNDVQVKID